MIISASRRTDIPAFFKDWFMNRIREGYCTFLNPMNAHHVVRVDLRPEQVDIIVFWTKNPTPLIPHLPELDERGYRYYFQYTVNGYGPDLEPRVPPLPESVSTFRHLADLIGSRKVIWRYDPIIFSGRTTPRYHLDRFAEIAAQLKGYTTRAVVSIVDEYRAAVSRLKRLAEQSDFQGKLAMPAPEELADFFIEMSTIAHSNNMEIFSCAEELDLDAYGIRHGRCIDDAYIADVFGLVLRASKDKSQRAACGCIASRDIGMYDTCLHDCAYCYATRVKNTKERVEQHNPQSPSLIGWYDAGPADEQAEAQLSMFEVM